MNWLFRKRGVRSLKKKLKRVIKKKEIKEFKSELKE